MYLLPTIGFLTFPLMVLICYFGATWVIRRFEDKFEN